jgi:hypothetical protein
MRRCGLLGLALLLTLAGPAHAATLGRGATSAVVSYTADPGEANAVTVSAALLVTSSAAMTVAGGSNCATSDPHQGACPGATSAALGLGDGDDSADVRNGVADSVDCGPGNDRVTADAADAVTGCEEVNLPPAPPAPPPTGGGGPAPLPTLAVSVAVSWSAGTTFTRVLKLDVSVATGSHAQLTCSGKKTACGSFAKKSVTAAKGHAAFTKLVKKSKLRSGAVLELRVTSPGTLGKRYRWTIAKKKVPKAAVTTLASGA